MRGMYTILKISKDEDTGVIGELCYRMYTPIYIRTI
jgi:hypothetical protein